MTRKLPIGSLHIPKNVPNVNQRSRRMVVVTTWPAENAATSSVGCAWVRFAAYLFDPTYTKRINMYRSLVWTWHILVQLQPLRWKEQCWGKRKPNTIPSDLGTLSSCMRKKREGIRMCYNCADRHVLFTLVLQPLCQPWTISKAGPGFVFQDWEEDGGNATNEWSFMDRSAVPEEGRWCHSAKPYDAQVDICIRILSLTH